MPVRKPIIGIPADRRMLGDHAFHAVGEKYIQAIAQAAEAVPLLIPSLGADMSVEQWLAEVDGIFFTGSPSNVEPHHYHGEASRPGTLHDAARDATTLALIPKAIAAGVPVLGVCRGFQEMNVACGGTLWQQVHEQPGFHLHHEDESQPLDVQYASAHEVILEPGGQLQAIAGCDRLQVNSLHHQGVRELGQGLSVEARAADGLIEAFRVSAARRFAIAVQWHPEWKVTENKFSMRLFAAFGTAARERAAEPA
jgi:putative glutamine amidotransferase